jgi:hypothetical protein
MLNFYLTTSVQSGFGLEYIPLIEHLIIYGWVRMATEFMGRLATTTISSNRWRAESNVISAIAGIMHYLRFTHL